ncbi:dihydrofolate reductase [Paenibacillus sp. GCM10027629]|uniref:dihydrofolate reductase n=1 Tax=Paenibacillus sp. GCM10027629 TaxID=3273414 RepID=UPI0036357E79
MGLSFVWAMGQNRVIGVDNKLPWRLPSDMAYFRRVTMGKTVLMGRKTYESIGKPLPNRRNVILTRSADYEAPGCEVIHSFEEVARLAENEEIMVIGGAEIYKQLLPIADRLHVTEIGASFEGDAFFPVFPMEEWKVVERTKGVVDEKSIYPHEFVVYERLSKS